MLQLLNYSINLAEISSISFSKTQQQDNDTNLKREGWFWS